MSDLKSCPCGAVPKVLYISTSVSGCRYAFVSGDCCGEWEIEFRAEYNYIDSADCMELAVKAWNAAKRNQGE